MALHVAGGRSGDAEYLLDGFEIGDPVSGELTSRLDVDSVREVKVDGRSLWRAVCPCRGVSDGTQHLCRRRSLEVRNHGFLPRCQSPARLAPWKLVPAIQLLGSLAQGRAWFSDGVSVQHTFSLIQGLPTNADTQEQWAGDNLLRVQMNLTPTNILQGNFLYNLTADSHLGLGLFTPLSTTTDEHAQREFVSVKDQIFFGRNMFELGAAIDDTARASANRSARSLTSSSLSTASGNYFQGLRQRNHRLQAIGNLNLSSLRWHGAHEVKAGFNADGLAFSQGAVRNPIETLRADNTLLLTTTFNGTPYYRLTNTQFGYFLQDSWKVLSPAGHSAREEERIGIPVVGKTLLGPRLAANYLPFRDNRTKISVGWGIYYRPINMALWGERARSRAGWTPFMTRPGPADQRPPLRVFFALRRASTNRVQHHQRRVGTKTSGQYTFTGVTLLRRVEDDGFAYNESTPASLGRGCFCLRTIGATAIAPPKFGSAGSSGARRRFMGITPARAPAATRPWTILSESVFCAQAAGPLLWDTPNRLISWGKTPLPLGGLFLSYRVESFGLSFRRCE